MHLLNKERVSVLDDTVKVKRMKLHEVKNIFIFNR